MVERYVPVALFDMDDTLCDYSSVLFESLKRLELPGEESFRGYLSRQTPKYILERAALIRGHEDWWVNLPKLKLGWDVLDVARDLGYKIKLLSSPPKKIPAAFTGKKRWADKYLGEDVDLSLSRDKAFFDGDVLVDDWVEYVEEWKASRKNGLVIMPANEFNAGYKDKQVIRYDGSNLDEVLDGMRKVKKSCSSNGYFGL